MLHHEELLWKQNARCDWLVFEIRRKHNRIVALKNRTGEWVTDEYELKQEAKSLWGYSRKTGRLGGGTFPTLEQEEIQFLNMPVSSEEIKKAFLDMAPLKAPGSDGLHAFFYQSQWDFVSLSICEWVKRIFSGDSIDPTFNKSLIFRPISLCSVLYKLVMEVIANRFKIVFPKLIGPEHARFVA
ncbi:reverse transcriptase [Gossypium australe]|uniref:Reverse transcriptase n=1 Tax=Gossypium australe TaxID=47621 RepID=A0A5B6V9D1_9ROSI|nr:reverse transcriptase [Gossypium australe]